MLLGVLAFWCLFKQFLKCVLKTNKCIFRQRRIALFVARLWGLLFHSLELQPTDGSFDRIRCEVGLPQDQASIFFSLGLTCQIAEYVCLTLQDIFFFFLD